MKTGWAALLLLAACNAPAAVPEDRLVEALAAFHLLEARHEQIGDVTDGVRDSLLAHYGFTAASFRQELDRLTEDLALGDTVYGRVEALLERRQRGDSLAR